MASEIDRWKLGSNSGDDKPPIKKSIAHLPKEKPYEVEVIRKTMNDEIEGRIRQKDERADDFSVTEGGVDDFNAAYSKAEELYRAQ